MRAHGAEKKVFGSVVLLRQCTGKKRRRNKEKQRERKEEEEEWLIREILYVDIGLLLGHSRVIHHLWADSSGKVASSEKLCERRFCLSIGAV